MKKLMAENSKAAAENTKADRLKCWSNFIKAKVVEEAEVCTSKNVK